MRERQLDYCVKNKKIILYIQKKMVKTTKNYIIEDV